MTDKEIEAGIKKACECDCAPPSTGWTVNPFPIIRDYMGRIKHRVEVAERALATVCEEVLHSRYPVEYVTVSVVEDFIQLTLKDAEKELAEEGSGKKEI